MGAGLDDDVVVVVVVVVPNIWSGACFSLVLQISLAWLMVDVSLSNFGTFHLVSSKRDVLRKLSILAEPFGNQPKTPLWSFKLLKGSWEP